MFSFVFQIFNGNSGKEDVVKHSLVSFTRARFVRFQPTEFHNQKTLRVEIYGVPVPAGRVNRIAILHRTRTRPTRDVAHRACSLACT